MLQKTVQTSIGALSRAIYDRFSLEIHTLTHPISYLLQKCAYSVLKMKN